MGLQSVLTLLSQLLNEIMPMIYKRFTEKAAEEWRQIYKVRGTIGQLWRYSNVLGSPTPRIPD